MNNNNSFLYFCLVSSLFFWIAGIILVLTAKSKSRYKDGIQCFFMGFAFIGNTILFAVLIFMGFVEMIKKINKFIPDFRKFEDKQSKLNQNNQSNVFLIKIKHYGSTKRKQILGTKVKARKG